MAKKSVDLFQLLQKRRSKGSFKIAPEPETREAFDPVGVVADWFRGLTAGTPRKRKPKRKSAASRQRAIGILVSGPTLAGLTFGCLVVGFLLGQGLGSEAPDDLRVGGGERLEPGWVPPAVETGILSPTEQLRSLGTNFYLLGAYPTGSDQQAARQKAERLATYLRAQGLDRTRIYKYWADDGDNLWVTLYYTDGPGVDQQALDRLKAVAAPVFAPRWTEFLGQLAVYPQAATLQRP